MLEFLIYSKRCFVDNVFTEATLHIKKRKIHAIYKGIHNVENISFDVRYEVVLPAFR